MKPFQTFPAVRTRGGSGLFGSKVGGFTFWTVGTRRFLDEHEPPGASIVVIGPRDIDPLVGNSDDGGGNG